MKRISKPESQKVAAVLFVFFWFSGFQIQSSSAEPLVIGSKKFTESYVLAEIAKRSLGRSGLAAEHRPGMGGTIILWEALRTGQIAVYPEYTGTIAEEILKDRGASIEKMSSEL